MHSYKLNQERLFLSPFPFPPPLMPPGFLLINRGLGDTAHRIVGLLSGCHAHLNEQSEPTSFVVVQAVLLSLNHVSLAGVVGKPPTTI